MQGALPADALPFCRALCFVSRSDAWSLKRLQMMLELRYQQDSKLTLRAC